MRRLAAGAAVTVLCAALGYLLFSSPRITALDFRAFYCAGTVMRAHADPYRTHPLHECETGLHDSAFAFYNSGTTLPAPLPPYGIAPFCALSLLPFHVAKALWGALLALAVVVLFSALLRLTRLPLPVVTCALLTTLVGTSLALGQLIPLYAAALACTALFAHERRFSLAALAAAFSLIEPHLGIPVCLSLFVWMPQARRTLAVCLAFIAALSIVFGGWALNVEYASSVLPSQTLSEVTSDGQLSFAVIAHALGAGDALAVRLGTLSYIFAGAFGIFAASVAARRFASAAFIVAVPAATSVFGGSYVHSTDLVAAVPLALLLVGRTAVNRIVLGVALALLVLPWLSALDSTPGLQSWFFLGALSSSYLLWYLTKNIATSGVFGACALACLLGLGAAYASAYHAFLSIPHHVHVTIAAQFPQASWQRAVEQRFSSAAAAAWALRAFYWLALAVLIALAVVSPRRHADVTGCAELFASNNA